LFGLLLFCEVFPVLLPELLLLDEAAAGAGLSALPLPDLACIDERLEEEDCDLFTEDCCLEAEGCDLWTEDCCLEADGCDLWTEDCCLEADGADFCTVACLVEADLWVEAEVVLWAEGAFCASADFDTDLPEVAADALRPAAEG
jgi:hypothetical protein